MVIRLDRAFVRALNANGFRVDLKQVLEIYRSSRDLIPEIWREDVIRKQEERREARARALEKAKARAIEKAAARALKSRSGRRSKRRRRRVKKGERGA